MCRLVRLAIILTLITLWAWPAPMTPRVSANARSGLLALHVQQAIAYPQAQGLYASLSEAMSGADREFRATAGAGVGGNFQGAIPAQQAYLKASNTDAVEGFGYSVAVSGDTAVVGAIFESSNATGVNGNQNDNSAQNSGAAYVFVRNGATWSQQAYLKASNTDASDRF